MTRDEILDAVVTDADQASTLFVVGLALVASLPIPADWIRGVCHHAIHAAIPYGDVQ